MNFKKKIIAGTIGCAAISFPLILAACGDDSSSNSSDNTTAEDYIFSMEELEEMGVPVFNSADDLKKEKCGDENEFETVYVEADNSFYMCDNGKWDNEFLEELPVFESMDEVGKCDEDREGLMFKMELPEVNGNTAYETFICEHGKWVSDFGGNDDDTEEVEEIVESDTAETVKTDTVETVAPKAVVKGTMTDKRDGKTYQTVKIGKQTWMAENLNYKTSSGSYCYDDDEENCDKYGRLYTWVTAVGKTEKQCGDGHECDIGTSFVQGVCPSGWHMPKYVEWETLFKALGDSLTTGKALMAASGWGEDAVGTDDYGFSALPGGLRNNFGNFNGDGVRGYFWSTKQGNTNGAFYVDLFSDRVTATLYVYRKSYALSVRCVKGKV